MVLLCFSHLKWDFVYQRPQHLMSRFAKEYPVYFIEEPIIHDKADSYSLHSPEENIYVVKLYVCNSNLQYDQQLQQLLTLFIEEQKIEKFISWYYSPMFTSFTTHLESVITVYDCMDELSAFKSAPSKMKEAEEKLLQKADVVFTGGNSLYRAKKHLHHNIHAFPSSIDKNFFMQARNIKTEPADQQNIPHPRLGFYGVIDERFDIDLIQKAADAKPGWHFIFIGPLAKISKEDLPHRNNIHYLGIRSYNELPAYISGWDIALVPFALNESTKYISPTKTPEYLAAGKPVISTAIEDVVHPYGDLQLVHIIHSADEFIETATQVLNTSKERCLKKTDAFLAATSWNNTWQNMHELMQSAMNKKQIPIHKKTEAYV